MAYDAASALALRMIASKGKLVTFSRAAGGVIDPVTQSGRAAPTTYAANAVAFPLSAGRAAFLFGAGAQNIQKKRLDLHIALKGVTTEPKNGDRFSWGGKTYAIITDPELLDPDGAGPFYAHAVAEAA